MPLARSASRSVRESACDRARSISATVAALVASTAASTAASLSRSALPHEVRIRARSAIHAALERNATVPPALIEFLQSNGSQEPSTVYGFRR